MTGRARGDGPSTKPAFTRDERTRHKISRPSELRYLKVLIVRDRCERDRAAIARV
jgi:hypothetical protein